MCRYTFNNESNTPTLATPAAWADNKLGDITLILLYVHADSPLVWLCAVCLFGTIIIIIIIFYLLNSNNTLIIDTKNDRTLVRHVRDTILLLLILPVVIIVVNIPLYTYLSVCLRHRSSRSEFQKPF